MSKTKYLQIQLDQNFPAYEIPRLRAAIIEKTRRESDLYHNHLGDDQYIYRYPLIQYKIKDKKPCLICLADATDDIHYFLRNRDFRFNINRVKYDFEIENVWLRYYQIQTWDTEFTYNILHYMALNQENYAEYKKIEGLVSKIKFLEERLYNHVSLFAEEMNAHLPLPIQVEIINIKEEKYIEYKEIFHLTFTMVFKCNLLIPEYAGIGKGVSVGFGIVRQIEDRQ